MGYHRIKLFYTIPGSFWAVTRRFHLETVPLSTIETVPLSTIETVSFSPPRRQTTIISRAVRASTHVAGESTVFEGGGPAGAGLARVPGGR